MTPWPEQLYKLLPAVHQTRDGEQGEPLRQLLGLIGEQIQLVQDDIGGLYDNWFIETCDNWVVPYLGDLVGFQQVESAGAPADPASPRGQLLNRFLFPRREIANLVHRRRRKGTLSVLEDVARDVTGWSALAVEFGRLVQFTQHSRFPRPDVGGTLDARLPALGSRLNTPFDLTAHVVDVGSMRSLPGVGWSHPYKVGLFVWRRDALALTFTRPSRLCTHGNDANLQVFTLNRLGRRQMLYVRQRPDLDEFAPAAEGNVPMPLLRRLLQDPGGAFASDSHYGADEPKSLAIYVRTKANDAWSLIPRTRLLVADLSRSEAWSKVAVDMKKEIAAVDPECGILMFPKPCQSREVRVNYHYSQTGRLGGGGYERSTQRRPWQTIRLGAADEKPSRKPTDLFDQTCREMKNQGFGSETSYALTRLNRANVPASIPTDSSCEGEADPPAVWRVRENLCIELLDSDSYTIRAEDPLEIGAGKTLEIRAASQQWPLVQLDLAEDRPCGDPWTVRLGPGSRLVIDGLQMCGATIRIVDGTSEGDAACDLPEVNRVSSFVVRHATLIPGGRTPASSHDHEPGHASLSMCLLRGRLVIDRSITGTLNIEHPTCDRTAPPTAMRATCIEGPLTVQITDSIVHAAWGRPAIASECCWPAHADLTIERTTVLGDICAQQISRAEDSLFAGVVHVQRRSHGYMRFCYVPTEFGHLPRLHIGETDLRLASLLNCAWDRWLQPLLDRGRSYSAANCCGRIRTPSRFKCLPHPIEGVSGQAKPCSGECGPYPEEHLPAVSAAVPIFVTTEYGSPGYCELALNCPREILRGAEDESELGAYHDNYWPQRCAALEARLQEYTPANIESAVIYADDLHPNTFGPARRAARRHSQ
jgi:hypothetical protein